MHGESLALHLKMIFQAALNDRVIPDEWKKGNIVPVHKKDLKIILINYRRISLLPILFIENELLIVCLCGFLLGDSVMHFVTLKYNTENTEII